MAQRLQDSCACLQWVAGKVLLQTENRLSVREVFEIGENPEHRAIVVIAILLPMHPGETSISAQALKWYLGILLLSPVRTWAALWSPCVYNQSLMRCLALGRCSASKWGAQLWSRDQDGTGRALSKVLCLQTHPRRCCHFQKSPLPAGAHAPTPNSPRPGTTYQQRRPADRQHAHDPHELDSRLGRDPAPLGAGLRRRGLGPAAGH